jgi:hypothetical protein
MNREGAEPIPDADADRAIMAFIRGSRKAHELPRVGPFALLLTDVTRLRYLNYGIPDDGADPTVCRASSSCHLWHQHSSPRSRRMGGSSRTACHS